MIHFPYLSDEYIYRDDKQRIIQMANHNIYQPSFTNFKNASSKSLIPVFAFTFSTLS